MSTHIINPQFVKELYMGEHNLLSDEIVACLMDPAFIYDHGNHLSYSDIIADELPEVGGYLRGSKILNNIGINFTGGHTVITCDSIEWTASGGNIGALKSICIVNKTHQDERVLGCVTIPNAYTIVNGLSFLLNFPSGIFNAFSNFPN